MIKAIVFDLGGVYLNRGIKIAFHERFPGLLKISMDKARLVELVDKNLYEAGFMAGKIAEDQYWKLCEKSLGIRLDSDKMRRAVLESFKEQKLVISLVKRLRKHYRLVLLSDMPREWMDWLEKRFGIFKNFDEMVVSGFVGAAKPKPKIYQILLQQTGLQPSECLFIDDQKHNLVYPQKIGMKTVLFSDARQLQRELKSLGIKF